MFGDQANVEVFWLYVAGGGRLPFVSCVVRGAVGQVEGAAQMQLTASEACTAAVVASWQH